MPDLFGASFSSRRSTKMACSYSQTSDFLTLVLNPLSFCVSKRQTLKIKIGSLLLTPMFFTNSQTLTETSDAKQQTSDAKQKRRMPSPPTPSDALRVPSSARRPTLAMSVRCLVDLSLCHGCLGPERDRASFLTSK